MGTPDISISAAVVLGVGGYDSNLCRGVRFVYLVGAVTIIYLVSSSVGCSNRGRAFDHCWIVGLKPLSAVC